MSEMQKVPFIHRTRNRPQRVRFTDEHVIVDLADGRAIATPLDFFPRLKEATQSQRENYQLYHVSVIWEELDEGIDLIAMLTGLYAKHVPEPAVAKASAATT